jgi:hypothetical protein
MKYASSTAMPCWRNLKYPHSTATATGRALFYAELVVELEHVVWFECNSCPFNTIHAIDRVIL